MKFLIFIATLLLSIHFGVGHPIEVYTPTEAARITQALEASPHDDPLMHAPCGLGRTITEAVLAFLSGRDSQINPTIAADGDNIESQQTPERLAADTKPGSDEAEAPGFLEKIGYSWTGCGLLFLVCDTFKIFFFVFGIITFWARVVEYINGSEGELQGEKNADLEKNGESTRPVGTDRKTRFSDDIIVEVYQPRYDETPPFYDDIYNDDELYDVDLQPASRPFRDGDDR